MSSAKSFRQLVGIPPSTASTQDSALIIIDAQNEYAEGQLKVVNVDQSRKAIGELLEKYRKAGATDQIIHVVHQVPEGAPVFTPNSRLAEEFEELKPKAGEKFIKKEQAGSFTGTDLEAHLKSLGDRGKKVVLTGYMSHVCVSTTARQADELQLEVLLAKDAIGDRDIPGSKGQDLVESSLTELADAFGTIISSKDVQ